MKRKVIQIADSTQLISLPRKWALKFGIKKGDELEVEEDGSKIIIITDKGLKKEPLTVNIDALDRTSIIYYIQSLYRAGYDELHINFNNPLAPHLRIGKETNVLAVLQQAVNRLPGYEIIQQKEGYCLIKNLQEASIKEFDTALRRTYLLLTDAYNNFAKGVKSNNFSLLESIDIHNETISRFINYCLRILNKKSVGELNSTVMHHILSNLDKLMDVLKYTARDVVAYNKSVKKETLEIFEMINNSVQMYYDYFYNFDIKKIAELYKNRDKTIKKMKAYIKKLPSEEVSLIVDMEHALEILVEMTSSRVALEN